jgi:predicted RNA polymerase sigma factor
MAFQPGHSGNPAGRPKGCRDKVTRLKETLADLMPDEPEVKRLAVLLLKLPTDRQALEVLRTIRKLYKSQDQSEISQ